MDRNTVVGLVLIGLILSVFTIFNQPTQEEIAKQKQEQKLRQKIKSQEANKKNTVQATSTATTKADTKNDKVPANKPAETIRLENDKLIVDVTTAGGQIDKVYLKDYQTYHQFTKKDKNKSLLLFDSNDSRNSLILNVEGREIETKDLSFEVVSKEYDKLVLKANIANEKSVVFNYDLSENTFDLGYSIKLNELEGAISKGVFLDWRTDFKKTERLFSEQRRVSTICYQQEKEGFDYLSETSDDNIDLEDQVSWVAYKQSYFSSILRPERPFVSEDSKMVVRNFGEGEKKINTHLKSMKSKLKLDFKETKQSSLNFQWYFGPNDYEVLNAHHDEYNEILNFGWGLFRWINVYAIQPLFTLFLNLGLPIGIAILLLTIALKFVLMPVQWKMYVSSAKMRILKPEVDELNAKFPNKEDAMKKQMEMMTLYRESGASPLAGCLPALIQMPILLAVFRFFPAAFEMRQKSFLWAEDLSSYDSIWDFGVYLWPYGDHVSLFTLLMAGTTLLYTHMNSGQMQQPSQPGMPNMKILMYMMPVMMIFFFNNYSSGLSYYYFISTLVSILIMLMIKHFFVDEEKIKLKMAERKANSSSKPKKGKSKFQERLELMQKMQQEKMKKK